MKLLALDTATEACSAAVLVDDEVVECFELAPRRHADLILSMIEEVLAETELRPAQLDGLAFGRGPGSFTGLRIATGVAQGMAFAADLPVVPVSTLAAMALHGMREYQVDRVAAALDARMGEIYWGVYAVVATDDETQAVRALAPERVLAPEQASLPESGDWLGVGSGWTTYGQGLAARLGITGQDGAIHPRAWDVALLGAADLKKGRGVTAEQALPVYLRDKVAQTMAERG